MCYSQSMNKGYTVLKNIWQPHTIRRAAPHRGHRAEGGYWHSSSAEPQPQLSVWWEQQFDRDPVGLESYLWDSSFVFYTADTVWSAAGNTSVHPHVDTPYRFSDWSGDDRLLAQQFILPLTQFNSWSGATGIVEGSHVYTWPIDACYRGDYDEFFLANCVQPELEPGDCLMYDPRLLHSTMPNYSDLPRGALLVSYVSSEIVELVRELDEALR